MAAGAFQSNSSAWAKLAVSDEVRAALEAVAESGKAIAEGLAADFVVTGDYQGSFNVRADTVVMSTGYGAHEAAAGVLENTSGHALAVEWGNSRDPKAHHVLGRTLGILAGG